MKSLCPNRKKQIQCLTERSRDSALDVRSRYRALAESGKSVLWLKDEGTVPRMKEEETSLAKRGRDSVLAEKEETVLWRKRKRQCPG
jgi:hypothetical protein